MNHWKESVVCAKVMRFSGLRRLRSGFKTCTHTTRTLIKHDMSAQMNSPLPNTLSVPWAYLERLLPVIHMLAWRTKTLGARVSSLLNFGKKFSIQIQTVRGGGGGGGTWSRTGWSQGTRTSPNASKRELTRDALELGNSIEFCHGILYGLV